MESSRELLDAAARGAVQDGTSDLDTEYLLWAATQVEPTRRLLAQAGVERGRLGGRIASSLLGGEAEPGDTIVADVKDDSLHCTIRTDDKE